TFGFGLLSCFGLPRVGSSTTVRPPRGRALSNIGIIGQLSTKLSSRIPKSLLRIRLLRTPIVDLKNQKGGFLRSLDLFLELTIRANLYAHVFSEEHRGAIANSLSRSCKGIWRKLHHLANFQNCAHIFCEVPKFNSPRRAGGPFFPSCARAGLWV